MIRRMEETDLEQIAALEKACFSMPWSLKGFQETVLREEYIYLVETGEDGIAGYAGLLLIGEEGDIISVAVHPECRNRQIGYRLLEALLQEGRDRGIREFTLEVRVGNTPAIHIYKKAGFVSVGIRPGYYESPREDALIMWKRQAGQGTITT